MLLRKHHLVKRHVIIIITRGVVKCEREMCEKLFKKGLYEIRIERGRRERRAS